MKKFLLLNLFFTVFSFGQTITLKYEDKRIISDENKNNVPSDILEHMQKSKYYDFVISDGKSIYKDAPITASKPKDSTGMDSEIGNFSNSIEVQNTVKAPTEYWYKNLNTNQTVFKIFNGQKNFNGKDNLKKYDWKIVEEYKEILGFKCQKATTIAYNKEFTAWFAESIKSNNGPEKYDGLPGLILELSTSYFVNKAISINFNTETTLLSEPILEGKIYTFKDMEDYEKSPENRFSNITKTQSTKSMFGNTEVETFSIRN